MWWSCQPIFCTIYLWLANSWGRQIWEFSVGLLALYSLRILPWYWCKLTVLMLWDVLIWLGKERNWISYSPLQPLPTVNQGISEIKAKQVFEVERWRGEGQLKVFCLWNRNSEGKVWWWVREMRREPQCSHETGFHAESKLVINILSWPGLNQPIHQHSQAQYPWSIPSANCLPELKSLTSISEVSFCYTIKLYLLCFLKLYPPCFFL